MRWILNAASEQVHVWATALCHAPSCCRLDVLCKQQMSARSNPQQRTACPKSVLSLQTNTQEVCSFLHSTHLACHTSKISFCSFNWGVFQFVFQIDRWILVTGSKQLWKGVQILKMFRFNSRLIWRWLKSLRAENKSWRYKAACFFPGLKINVLIENDRKEKNPTKYWLKNKEKGTRCSSKHPHYVILAIIKEGKIKQH